jgi:DNA-binding CsgD family transcriptional regulator
LSGLERDHRGALAIAASLMRHWILADHFEEGAWTSTAALSVTDETDDPATRAPVQCGAGLIETLSEDYAAALARTQAGIALLGEVGNRDVQARCLQMSGMVLILTGLDLAEGLRMAERAVELIVGSPERALRHADLALELEGARPSMTHFVLICNRVHGLALLGRAQEAVEEGLRAEADVREAGAPMAAPAIEMALAVAELMNGQVESAESRARPLLEVPQTHTIALMREVLAQTALARGDGHDAGLHGSELALLAQQTGSPRHRALADYLLGSAAIIDREPEHGRELLQRSLAGHSELGLVRGAADALEELGLVAASAGDVLRGARLVAAANAARPGLDCAALPRNAERVANARAQFVQRDGDEAWDTAWAEGEALALADAIAYARRARGPRRRPPAGWASLTSAELEVAQLAADGLSNPAIASHLFMSCGTVKMHLSSVYLKLGIANRAQLAREMATRAVDPAAAADPVQGRTPDPSLPRHGPT